MVVQTIAVFHTSTSLYSAWSSADGIAETLSKMGYDVINCGYPAQQYTPLSVLETADLIIMSSPEYYAGYIAQQYGSAWNDLRAHKVAWFMETAERDDRVFDFRSLLPFADTHYFPAKQDAATFAGGWLPLAVDTRIFYPRVVQQTHFACFLGLLYPKRVEYLARIGFPLPRINSPFSDDIVQSTNTLAETYCSMKILINLPAYSRSMVLKISEVMACRTMIVTPQIDHESGRENMNQYTHGKHLIYYDPERPQQIGDIIRYFANNPTEREQIANQGWREVHRGHSLRSRLEKIISDVRFRKEPGGPTGCWQDQSSASDDGDKRYFYLRTYHGTFVCVGQNDQRLYHEGIGGQRLKVVVELCEASANFYFLDPNVGMRRRFVISNPAGNYSENLETIETRVDYVWLDSERISFRANDKYVAADEDGVVRADRGHCREFEQYNLVEAEEIEEMMRRPDVD